MPDPSPAERWRAVAPYLDRALELTDEERAAWLAALGAEDRTMAAEVEALLARRDTLSHEVAAREQARAELLVREAHASLEPQRRAQPRLLRFADTLLAQVDRASGRPAEAR